MHLDATSLSVGQALAVVATATAVQAGLNTIHWPYTSYASAGTAVSLVALLSLTYRSRTLGGWIQHRRACTRRIPRLTQRLSHNGIAILWDHTHSHTSILIKITPKPFTLNVVDETGNWRTRTLDLNPIRHELRQFDIQLHNLTLVTVGYTYAQQNALAKVAFSTTGPINAICYGHTYLRVTLDTTTAANSIRAREIDSYPDPREVLASGLARTIQIAADRAHRAITLQGFIAEKLSRPQAEHLHHDLVGLLGAAALGEEGFTHAGTSAPHLVAFTPTSNITTVTDATDSEWLRATTEVCAVITKMSPASATDDHIQRFYCNRVERLDTLALAEATNLRKEYGQHAAIATTALPLAVPPPITAVPQLTIPTSSQPAALSAIPGGVGIYLGHTHDGAAGHRVWLDIAVASEEPLWIIGPRHAMELILIRSATLGLRIDVRVPELAAITHALRHAGLGAHDNPDISVSLFGEHQQTPAPVRYLWSPQPIRARPRYVIDATAPAVLQVHTPQQDRVIRWELNSAESALITSSPASPTATVPLR